ncbi:MAG: PDZ domain-containing protein [Deltaproteobacteria bacterium]|nr:PDZ domain-containing protein [Deltaproteobacteria bacterium]
MQRLGHRLRTRLSGEVTAGRAGIGNSAWLAALIAVGSLAIAPEAGAAWSFREAPAQTPSVGDGGVGMVLDGQRTAKRTAGVYVARVVPGGPAATAGLRPGDRIVAVGGDRLPDDVTVADVARRIRGKIGSRVQITVRADGSSGDRSADVERVAMESLFPTRVGRPLEVAADLALIATGAQHTIAIRFLDGGTPTEALRYAWAVAPAGKPAGTAGGARGEGLVRWTSVGATVQVDDLRVDLAPWPGHDRLVAAGSNLPVVVTDAAHWLTLDPSAQKVKMLRAPPKGSEPHWPAGGCKLTVKAAIGDAAFVLHRITLELRDGAGRVMPTATALTDADGEATFALPAGDWSAIALHHAKGGGHRDLAYAAKITAPATAVRCEEGQQVRLALPLQRLSEDPAGALPPTALQHPLVGKKLPEVHVRRWVGDGGRAPEAGDAMLLYVWATWCGPCKRTSPEIAEIAARAAGTGLRVVLASADRDETALEDYVAALPPDGPPVAWTGPDLLETLEVRGIPTVVLVDGSGVIRAVHTGTGISIATWQRAIAEVSTPHTPAPAAKAERKPRPKAGSKRK